MRDTDTFIFVHDQEIILACEKEGRFNTLPNLHYVFLGNRDTHKIENIKNIIIARNLLYNIEKYPCFTYFSGWYALWKNNLIDSYYINLFEYDVVIKKDFRKSTEHLNKKKCDFIGYLPLPMNVAFINHPQYLANIVALIEHYYHINIRKYVSNLIRDDDKSGKWSSTSNSTFNYNTFYQYMQWAEQFIDGLKEHKMAGHALERSITFFNLLYRKKCVFVEDVLIHEMKNSHGT